MTTLEKNERMNVDEFIEMQTRHYEHVWDMGVRDLSFPLYPVEFITWQGRRVVFCEHSSDVILYSGCEYCGENRLDKNNCCMSCSAPVEM